MNQSKTVQIHLHISKLTKPELAEKVKILIAKRKMNKIMIELLGNYFKEEKKQGELFED